ncbi:hypothetical protein ROZALSC1DRAFT_28483, partial [Rozella allomycis CSF55]
RSNIKYQFVGAFTAYYILQSKMMYCDSSTELFTISLDMFNDYGEVTKLGGGQRTMGFAFLKYNVYDFDVTIDSYALKKEIKYNPEDDVYDGEAILQSVIDTPSIPVAITIKAKRDTKYIHLNEGWKTRIYRLVSLTEGKLIEERLNNFLDQIPKSSIIKEGDEIIIERKEKSLNLYWNGELKGSVQSETIGKLFLEIYIGLHEHVVSKDTRNQIVSNLKKIEKE